MKLVLATLVASFAATGAFAQTFADAVSPSNVAPVSKFTAVVGTLNSATTPRAVAVAPFENVFVSCVGTAATSQTIQYRVGTRVLETTAVACGTTPAVAVSRTAGTFGFNNIVVSPTAGLTAANVVTNTIVKTPALVR